MSELTSQITAVKPRRGRGPGVLVFADGNEVGVFDGAIIQQAASNLKRECQYTWKETEGKDGKKYKNLLTLSFKTEPPDGSSEDVSVRAEEALEAAPVLQAIPIQPLLAKPVALSRVEPLSAMSRLEQGFALAVRQRELLTKFIGEQFEESTHYMEGAVFGSKKRVLLLEGARLIHVCFGHVVTFEIVSGPMVAPAPNTPYTIVLKAKVQRGDVLIGEGVGSATSLIWSSKSARYQDRATSPDLTHNSTLKIAKKRAYIDSCLNTTALTEYSQDLDEYDKGKM